jgi:hypothetical protein
MKQHILHHLRGSILVVMAAAGMEMAIIGSLDELMMSLMLVGIGLAQHRSSQL